MKTDLLNLNPEEDLSFAKGADVSLSFGPFLRFIREKAAVEDNQVRKEFYEYVLEKFAPFPELEKAMDVTLLSRYMQPLEMIYALLAPAFTEERDTLWALAAPVNPIIFYGTDTLYDLIGQMNGGHANLTACMVGEADDIRKHKLKFMYGVILERVYGFNFLKRDDMVYSVVDDGTGLKRYFRANVDTRFLEVKSVKPLPELSFETIEANLDDQVDFTLFEKLLPMDLFSFEGISVLTLTEVTEAYALENIKNIILSAGKESLSGCYADVADSLKTLVLSNDIHFGLIPLLRINNELQFYPDISRQSVLLRTAKEKNIAENVFLTLAEEYIQHPRLIFFRKITEEMAGKYEFLKMLQQQEVSAYSLVPVFNNQRLIGMLEVYTRKEGLLEEKIMSKLDPAMPLLSQLLQHSIDELESRVEAVIKDKFTFLQPAVQWKFNEVAWKYLRSGMAGQEDPPMETIVFDQVFPLYGAVDIRDSTVERNNALHSDFRRQFYLLEQTFSAIKEKVPLALMDEMMFKCRKRMEAIEMGEADNDQLWLNEFLEHEVHPFLQHIQDTRPEVKAAVEQYFQDIDDGTGVVFDDRRRLENSMRMINEAVSSKLDLMKSDLQSQFPFYFEKFRTDGVEYDIYIGPSLWPGKPFSDIYLKNLRLWQLDSMAAIARKTHSLLPEMPVPLRTTQLIFVHSHPIDISFRNDERRFDVEGAYNIRYHVIKKRIDKVCIRYTSERLTQPGKIAIVYFNGKEASEYISYIRYLQETGVLMNDLEELELEELQGVSGLHALRVGVNLTYGIKEKKEKAALMERMAE